jgi:pSer/pThr/pTyr-binding forkhead associated (FHA) protein
MKLSLVVLTAGKMQGKAIPIGLSQFLIGRDRQCHLRPASPVISNRHCAVLVKGQEAFVRDFESTNGTFLNDRPVKGQAELHNGDQLRLGPVAFEVRIEATPVVTKPAPVPVAKAPVETVDDDALAALLLAVPEDHESIVGNLDRDAEGVPTGETVMDMRVPDTAAETLGPEDRPPSEQKTQPAAKSGDTASVANTLLQKYLRRGRNK